MSERLVVVKVVACEQPLDARAADAIAVLGDALDPVGTVPAGLKTRCSAGSRPRRTVRLLRDLLHHRYPGAQHRDELAQT